MKLFLLFQRYLVITLDIILSVCVKLGMCQVLLQRLKSVFMPLHIIIHSYPTHFKWPVSQKIGLSAQSSVKHDKEDILDYTSEKNGIWL